MDKILKEHSFTWQEIPDDPKAGAERYKYGSVLEPLSVTLPLKDSGREGYI